MDNLLVQADSRHLPLAPASVDLMVTSPPYNVTKQYDGDLSLEEYLGLLGGVLAETWRVLRPSGYVAVNITNVGRRPYIPLESYVIDLFRGKFEFVHQILWNKWASSGVSCAWGSWRSPSNPILRDVHEFIVVGQKPPRTPVDSERMESPPAPPILDSRRPFALDRGNLHESVWDMNAIRASAVGHPAPFPVELPYRVIQLFGRRGGVVLDPFVGSGSTCIAALASGMRYVGVDVETKYLALAQHRIDLWRQQNALCLRGKKRFPALDPAFLEAHGIAAGPAESRQAPKNGRKSVTLDFGVPTRESHDSSVFYSSRLYQDVPPEPKKFVDASDALEAAAGTATSLKLSKLPPHSVHLFIVVVETPLAPAKIAQIQRVLVTGGRVAVVVPRGTPAVELENMKIPLWHQMVGDLASAGFMMRGEAFWVDRARAIEHEGMHQIHDVALFFSHGSFKRPRADRTPTITSDGFVQASKSMWFVGGKPDAEATPATVPGDPYQEFLGRIIEFYAYQEDVIGLLVPKAIKGMTSELAQSLGRRLLLLQ
jgi:site-specific DNA-methyltransferase (adenine-specific)